MDAATQYALAYALTTTAGIRGLLALAAVSFGSHFGWIHLPDGFAWLGSWQATAILSGVAVLDIVGDKIPFVDHVLEVAGIVVKPAAGAILVGSVVHAQSHEQLVMLMVLGAINALGVHAASMAVRVASTMTTGGLANPLASFFEDAVSVAMLVAAFIAPYIAAFAALLVTLAVLAAVVRSRMRRHPAVS
jgi:uncharacterized membrane protein